MLPKRTKWREWKQRPSFLGFYLPLGEPRPIPDGAIIHQSVLDRIAQTPYRPVNLPQTYTTEPDPAPPLAGAIVVATAAAGIPTP